jgi:uncharacterized membrane protein YccC
MMNKIMFAGGLVAVLIAAALLFFVGTEKLGYWPMVLAIFGIGLLAGSGKKQEEK